MEAEGVETSQTLQLLRNASCDEAQGFLLSKPLPIQDLEEYLSRLPDSKANPAVAGAAG